MAGVVVSAGSVGLGGHSRTPAAPPLLISTMRSNYLHTCGIDNVTKLPPTLIDVSMVSASINHQTTLDDTQTQWLAEAKLALFTWC